MSLSQPRQFFGVHSVSPYSRVDNQFYGYLRVVDDSSLSLQGELVENHGGSSKFAWSAEDGQMKSELSIKTKEYPDFLFTLFLGKAPTATTADATGTLSTLTNVKGTSCKSATIGIASVGIHTTTGAADLKFGTYIVVVASATTVHVYGSSDLDYGAKTNTLTYQSDLLKITATALTITTGGVVTAIPNTGVDLIGGSGTIGMTVGDTARFHVNPPSSAGISVTIGGQNNTFPEFGALLTGQRRSTGEVVEIDVFRCKGNGMPLGLSSFKWAEADLKAKVLYDSTQDGIATLNYLYES
jgi:hypothetical protein